MGREVEPAIDRIRARCNAYRNILLRFEDPVIVERISKMSEQSQKDIYFYALRGEYSNMMTAYDKGRCLDDLTLVELRELGQKHKVYGYCRATRNYLIAKLTQKGVK